MLICRAFLPAVIALTLLSPTPAHAADGPDFTVSIDGVETKVTPKKAAKVKLKSGEVSFTLSAPKVAPKKTTFELTIAGEAFAVELGKKAKHKSKGEEKRTYEVLVTRWYPTYSMGPIRFQHPVGATLDDDEDTSNRSVTIEFEDDSIDVMDGRPVKGAKSLAKECAKAFVSEMESDPDWTSVKAQKAKKVRHATSSGWSIAVHTVDEEGDTFVSDFHVLESGGELVIVTLSYWAEEQKEYYERFGMVLDSIRFAK